MEGDGGIFLEGVEGPGAIKDCFEADSAGSCFLPSSFLLSSAGFSGSFFQNHALVDFFGTSLDGAAEGGISFGFSSSNSLASLLKLAVEPLCKME